MEAAFLQEGFDDLLRWVREAGRALVGPEVPARLETASAGGSAGLLFVRDAGGAPSLDRDARLRLVADADLVGTWSLDPASGAISADPCVMQLFDMGPGAASTLDAYVARLVPADRARFREAVEGALAGEGGGRVHVQIRAVGPAGALRWIEVRALARFDEPGRARDLVGTMADVTEQCQLEGELRLANERKDEFLAMLAHELRNPMAAIGTALALMERADGDPERTAKHRETARRQMKNVVRLVDDLLDISRITRGKIRLHKEVTDFAAVVQCALTATRGLLEARGHELTVTVTPGSFRMVADGTRLEQVVVNLLVNAAKYTDPGGKISVHLGREELERGVFAVLRVRDTGRGIPSGMLEHVFHPFVQLEPQADRETGNLGIGLALVRGLVTMHEGAVAAHSDGPGRGSEFELRLPLQADVELGGAAPAEPQVRATAFRRRRILIVDDAPGVRETLRDLLEELGHEVFVAADALEGVMQLKAVRPDVALVDVGMPRIDGYDFARRARAVRGSERTTLIALTGYGGADAKARARKAGFDLHLAKPVDLEALPGILLADRVKG
jgi:signal transduction histidine kinase